MFVGGRVAVVVLPVAHLDLPGEDVGISIVTVAAADARETVEVRVILFAGGRVAVVVLPVADLRVAGEVVGVGVVAVTIAEHHAVGVPIHLVVFGRA